MDARKIVKSGNTSFTLALPIQWVRKNRLDKGSTVNIAENEAGDLVVTPETPVPLFAPESITIKVDGKQDEIIDLELAHAYVRDFPTIILEGKDIRAKTAHILGQMKSYIGLDVIEQTADSITIKNFYSVSRETAPHVLIKKMAMVNRTLFEVLGTFFKQGFTKDDLAEAQRLRDHNERLYALIRKGILKLFEHPSLAKSAQTSPLQLSKEKVISFCFRNISQQLHNLGEAFLFLEGSKPEITMLRDAFASVQQNHDSVIAFMINKNYPLIFEYLRRCKEQISRWERSLRDVDDPLAVEGVHILIGCNLLFEDVAQQYIE
jgi:phosphate uptake regulator